MESNEIDLIAKSLHIARLEKDPIEQLSEKWPSFSRKYAYLIQARGIELREEANEQRVGLKMGLTSEEKRKQMDLDSPLYGVLTDKMQVQDGVFNKGATIHPKIEPEICFYIDKILEGDITREEVFDACSGVSSALEILDSRYKQFKYFSMEDVISDNSSSCAFALGNIKKNPREIDIKNLKMEMFINNKSVEVGSSRAISGDPVQSIIKQCALLAKEGKKLGPGTFVLAGAATAAVALEEGMDVALKVQNLGTFNIRIEG